MQAKTGIDQSVSCSTKRSQRPKFRLSCEGQLCYNSKRGSQHDCRSNTQITHIAHIPDKELRKDICEHHGMKEHHFPAFLTCKEIGLWLEDSYTRQRQEQDTRNLQQYCARHSNAIECVAGRKVALRRLLVVVSRICCRLSRCHVSRPVQPSCTNAMSSWPEFITEHCSGIDNHQVAKEKDRSSATSGACQVCRATRFLLVSRVSILGRFYSCIPVFIICRIPG